MPVVTAWLPALAALGASAWLALLVTTPGLPATVAAAVYAVGSLICHQMPERSFHLGASQLPVCARCLGIYAGAALGTLGAAATLAGLPPGERPGRAAGWWRGSRVWIAAAAVPTAATLLLEAAGVWPATNMVRACAGAPLGAAVGVMVAAALATLHYDPCPRPARPDPSTRT
jgi:uncharacterized membrane protein